jgi:hypothetical protein
MATAVFEKGGYRYIPAVSQYSGGVAAEKGFALHRVTFTRPVPLAEGFERIKAHLDEINRPLVSFCACELRSPEPFTEQGFRDFNNIYIDTLKDWGIYTDEKNPVARSNICPEINSPKVPSIHAFCYTVEDPNATPSFAVAGSAEAEEGHATYREVTVALGDLSHDGFRKKIKFVVEEMQRRMRLLGFDWSNVTATQIYTVHDFHTFIAEEFASTGALYHGLTWHFNRPPIVDLEFEMDCRGVYFERRIRV